MKLTITTLLAIVFLAACKKENSDCYQCVAVLNHIVNVADVCGSDVNNYNGHVLIENGNSAAWNCTLKGSHTCDTGYELEGCNVKVSEKFLGNFTNSTNCFTMINPFEINTVSNIMQVKLNNFPYGGNYMIGQINNSNQLDILQKVINGDTISGNATVNGHVLSYTLTINGVTCTGTATK